MIIILTRRELFQLDELIQTKWVCDKFMGKALSTLHRFPKVWLYRVKDIADNTFFPV